MNHFQVPLGKKLQGEHNFKDVFQFHFFLSDLNKLPSFGMFPQFFGLWCLPISTQVVGHFFLGVKELGAFSVFEWFWVRTVDGIFVRS